MEWWGLIYQLRVVYQFKLQFCFASSVTAYSFILIGIALLFSSTITGGIGGLLVRGWICLCPNKRKFLLQVL